MRRRSIVGPILLVVLGTALLIANLMPDWSLGALFAEHWPWLLIAWGGVNLLEQTLSPAFGWSRPKPLGGGAIVLAMLLAIAGTAARQARSADFGFVRQWDKNWFHEEKYSFPVELEVLAGPAGFRLDGLRGEVEIRGDEAASTIAVHGEMLLSGTTRDAAERRSTAAQPVLAETDGWTYLQAGDRVGASPGREYRLTIVVPAAIAVEAKNLAGKLDVQGVAGSLAVEGRGSVVAREMQGAVDLQLQHGERVEVSGAESLKLSGSAKKLDVRLVRGSVEIDGNLYRDGFLEDIGGAVTFLSRSTRLQAERIGGSVEIRGDRLIARGIQGLQLEAKGSRRVEVIEPAGETDVFVERGRLIVEPGADSGDMNVRGLRADVEARIGRDVSVSIETQAKRGEVRNFLESAEGNPATKGPSLRLESEGGDIEIRPTRPGEVSEKL